MAQKNPPNFTTWREKVFNEGYESMHGKYNENGPRFPTLAVPLNSINLRKNYFDANIRIPGGFRNRPGKHNQLLSDK